MTDYTLDGRYRLTERIASGGMGEVWAGIDEMLGRTVAIKLLSSQHAGDEQFRARFRAEARYAASLSHNGIARVYDYGENSPLGGPYLVMELVSGEPLSAILEREGRLPADVTLDIISQAARALAVAHQAGIVHRDIKPGNLLITADGVTKITDFGIAKAREAVDQHLTATGIVMGTAMYVSPEQATGATVTGSSDIYSLGVVAYECLAGQPPFVAEQPLAIAIMHKQDPVPPLPADIPRPVAELVLSMLAKEPVDRPESALHVADRADALLAAMSGRRLPEARSTRDLPQVPAATTVVPGLGSPSARSDYAPTMGVQDLPTQASTAYYDAERTPAPPYSEPYSPADYDDGRHSGGHQLNRRRLMAGGVGVGLCAIAAVAALVLTSNSHGASQVSSTTSPSVQPTPRSAARPTQASLRPSPTPPPSTATSLRTVPTTSAPAIVRTSAAPSKSPTPTVSPSPMKSTTPSPTAPPTTPSPTTTPSSTGTPTASASVTSSPTTTATATAPPTFSGTGA